MTSAKPASPTPALSPLPVPAQRSFADLAEDLRSSEGRATVLIGAGCSVSGGIPLAGGIIDDIRGLFPQAWNRAQKKAAECGQLSPNYNLCMQALSRDHRNTLLKGYIDRSKINWAHIGLAQLLKHKCLDRVLTTNFDQLITRACALVNVFPAVYDLTAFHPTQMRMAELPDLAVFHLHGQRNGFRLLNNPDELAQHAPELKPVFDHARERRLWIVVGYSGEADPLLALIQAERHECGLYWISTQPAPKPHLAELFTPERYAFHVHHPEGADHFFMKLALEMDAWPPTLLDQPFAHLREQLAPIAEFIQDGKQNNTPYYRDEPNGIDWLKQTRRQLDRAEALLKADTAEQSSPAHPSQDLDAYLTSGVSALQHSADPDVQSWAWVEKGDALADEAQSLAEKSDLSAAQARWKQAGECYTQALEVKKDKHEAAYNWGVTLDDEAHALMASDLPAARALWRQAGERYAQALKIKPDKHEAANNWGLALAQEAQALVASDLPAARALWRQAGERYAQALAIKPDYHDAANNWGIALHHEAQALAASDLPAARAFWQQAGERYAQALAIKPDMYDAANNWGWVLAQEAQALAASDLPAAQALWRQTGERYAQALAIKPDYHDAANNWGAALAQEAQALAASDLPAAQALWRQTGERYAQALAIKPDYHDAANNWGIALHHEAQALAASDLPAARAFWQQAGERYAQALAIKPDMHEAAYNWSVALLHEHHAIHHEHPDEAVALLRQAKTLLQQAESQYPGKAAYNLACVAACQHHPADAIRWLRTCQAHGTLPTEDHLRTDAALDPIRDTPEFTTWWAESFAAM
ncbi:hypothetical protein BXU06_11675 [Aquaspirillum sp. LM1]|uniref:TPR end-of-group domain-containing protein n=1 Tax=Aquaspirillum sp. LM1 TaxID=1938604 RepID=UPI000983B4EA|nr:hypothetical protein [Aquaspirillum sp. LM1]AQR65635.1 hypothetical protein BXU06_11675 [Aquaspirillum sp. LM1]